MGSVVFCDLWDRHLRIGRKEKHKNCPIKFGFVLRCSDCGANDGKPDSLACTWEGEVVFSFLQLGTSVT